MVEFINFIEKIFIKNAEFIYVHFPQLLWTEKTTTNFVKFALPHFPLAICHNESNEFALRMVSVFHLFIFGL